MEKFCCSIPVDITIKGIPVLPHGLKGIFISQCAIIGKNCTIFQQVTIGSNMLTGSKGFGGPIIGDNVLIGAGAKIIGNVKIGSNVKIGANAVVVKDIPDNATVVMVAPRIIIHKKND
jgi:serine O-acetyltransferase